MSRGKTKCRTSRSRLSGSGRPCPGCPWRKGATTDAIPDFSTKMALDLVHTTGSGYGFYTIMACHHSPVGEEFSCAGYLAAEGEKNVNVWILASRGQIDLRAAQEACKDEDLHPDFVSMLMALLGEEVASPALVERGLLSRKEFLEKSD